MNIFKKIKITIETINNLNIFFLDYFKLIKNKKIVYRLRNGLKFVARAGSTDASEIIVVNSDTEYSKKHYEDLNNPVVVDIGANIGSFSLYFANVFKNSQFIVHSIEPSLDNYEILKENIRINNFSDRIKPYNLAICSKDGFGYLNISGDHDSFFLADTESINTQKIEIVRLETFCKDNFIDFIDLLKVDIEGGEYDLFYNSIDFINKKVKNIFIEVHDIDRKNNMDVFK